MARTSWRGATRTCRLPLPRFGTPCAALLSAEERRAQRRYAATMMGDMDSGMMGKMMADPTLDHDHGDEEGEM